MYIYTRLSVKNVLLRDYTCLNECRHFLHNKIKVMLCFRCMPCNIVIHMCVCLTRDIQTKFWESRRYIQTPPSQSVYHYVCSRFTIHCWATNENEMLFNFWSARGFKRIRRICFVGDRRAHICYNTLGFWLSSC